VGDGDLVGGDRSSVHCAARLPYGLKKVNRKKKKITSFTISPTLLDGWRCVPYEPTTNRTWTPGYTGVRHLLQPTSSASMCYLVI
jgi:hypothetical protein